MIAFIKTKIDNKVKEHINKARREENKKVTKYYKKKLQEKEKESNKKLLTESERLKKEYETSLLPLEAKIAHLEEEIEKNNKEVDQSIAIKKEYTEKSLKLQAEYREKIFKLKICVDKLKKIINESTKKNIKNYQLFMSLYDRIDKEYGSMKA